MSFRESVSCAAGVMRLGIDAGIALIAIAVAVPVAFAIGEGSAMRRTVRGGHYPTGPVTDDLGTILTHR